jgi:hypothetical protein
MNMLVTTALLLERTTKEVQFPWETFLIQVLTSSYFCFNGQFCEETDGVSMGSPLSPVIAFFMEDFEKVALSRAAYKPTYWFRYLDDTFVIWPHGPEKLSNFFNHPNIHPNVQFTMETESNSRLPFPDISWDTGCTGNSHQPISECRVAPPLDQ